MGVGLDSPWHWLVLIVVVVALFGVFSIFFTNFLSVQVVVNLFMNNAHVGVIAVGMTFVILSGGIDLSVGSVLAFTTIFIATLIENRHFHPILAIFAALVPTTPPPMMTTWGGGGLRTGSIAREADSRLMRLGWSSWEGLGSETAAAGLARRSTLSARREPPLGL